RRIVDGMLEQLQDVCKVESPPRMEGKQMTALLAPKGSGSPAKPKPQEKPKPPQQKPTPAAGAAPPAAAPRPAPRRNPRAPRRDFPLPSAGTPFTISSSHRGTRLGRVPCVWCPPRSTAASVGVGA